MTMNHDVKRYWRKVRRRLRCPRAAREQVLRETQEVLADFLEENPEAGYADLCANIGDPRDLADTVKEIVPPEELKSYRRKRIALLVLLILLVIAAVGVTVWKITRDEVVRDPIVIEREVIIIE